MCECVTSTVEVYGSPNDTTQQEESSTLSTNDLKSHVGLCGKTLVCVRARVYAPISKFNDVEFGPDFNPGMCIKGCAICTKAYTVYSFFFFQKHQY